MLLQRHLRRTFAPHAEKPRFTAVATGAWTANYATNSGQRVADAETNGSTASAHLAALTVGRGGDHTDARDVRQECVATHATRCVAPLVLVGVSGGVSESTRMLRGTCAILCRNVAE